MPLEVVGGGSGSGGEAGKQKIDVIVYWNTSKEGGAGWDILDNVGHESVGVSSITSGSRSFTLNYDFTATEVLSFTTGVDETLGAAGYYIGTGPVGLTTAVCQIYQIPSFITGQVSWNGSTFVLANETGNLALRDFGVSESGELRLTHDECSEYAGQVTMGSGSDGVTAIITGQDGGQTKFKFFDASGSQITSGATTMNFYFNRPTNGFGIKNQLSSVAGPLGGQFFIHGEYNV